MALNNTSMPSTKRKHPLIQWSQYAQNITEQTHIGWHQIKYRRFLLPWHSKQQQYDTFTRGNNNQGAPKWIC
eukprot:4325983-Ditylum_brightwellii.AAC.1